MRLPEAAQVLLLTLALATAGCAGSSDGEDEAEERDVGTRDLGNSTSAAEVGIIEGVVLDEEDQPVGGAIVGIVELGAQVETTQNGSFQFTNVPVGHYTLAVARLGYEAGLQGVDVRAGETLEVEIGLTMVPLVDPHFEVFHHSAIHHAGQAHVDWALGLFGQYPWCEGCDWNFTTEANPQALLVEITGEHAVANPLGDAEHLYVWDAKDGDLIENNGHSLPVYASFDREAYGDAIRDFRIQALCEIQWVCFEERREIYVTAFYDMDMPEGYTALPPP